MKLLKKLNDQQRMFALEYLKDLNATQAAIRAGYSAKTATQKGKNLLNQPLVAEYVTHLKTKRMEKLEVDSTYVLQRLIQIDLMDVKDVMNDDGTVKPVQEWPDVWRQMLSGMDVAEMFEGRGDERQLVGILKKMKWPDKVKTLELIGKHVDVQAFKEKVEHSGDLSNIQPVINVNIGQ